MGGSRLPKGGRGALIFEADTSEYISVYTFPCHVFHENPALGGGKKRALRQN